MLLIRPSRRPTLVAALCAGVSMTVAAAAGTYCHVAAFTTVRPNGTEFTISGPWEGVVGFLALFVVPLSATVILVTRIASPRDWLPHVAICGASPSLTLEFVEAVTTPRGRQWFATWPLMTVVMSISIALLCVLFGVGVFFALRILGTKVGVRSALRCSRCEYDLTGLAIDAPCPECRSVASGSDSIHTPPSVSRRVTWWMASVCVFLLASSQVLYVIKAV